jgi:hypothetical protein
MKRVKYISNVTLRGLPHNQCCLGKVVSIAYCECERLALIIQHGQGMPLIILSVVLFGSTTFFHIISQTARFKKGRKKENIIEHKFV